MGRLGSRTGMNLTAAAARSVAGAGLLMLMSTAVATALPSFERSTRVRFSEDAGRAPSGLFVASGEPVPDVDRSDMKPPKTLTKLVLRLPAGMTYAAGRTPACNIDRWIQGGCPKLSRVGITVVHLIVAPPDPRYGTGVGCLTRGSAYHARRRLLLTSVPSVFCTPLDRDGIWVGDARFAEKGRLITIDNPDGPVNFFVLRLKSRELLRTPGQCPRSRRWSTRVTAHYDDGTKDSVVTRQPCHD